MDKHFPLITILGPTAVGKTAFAVKVAKAIDAEIISADSRQVFKGMDIGTGKDMQEYDLGDCKINSHLIDIVEPGTEYNVFNFTRDFANARNIILNKGKTPLLCGGTGLYLQAVLAGYNLEEVPVNQLLRSELQLLTHAQLLEKLSSMRSLHNTTDSKDKDRLIRAIEIESFKADKGDELDFRGFKHTPVFGLLFDRKIIRDRITSRLSVRLEGGMIEEVERLLKSGVTVDRMKFYGLEYKFVTMYLTNEISYQTMLSLLNTAIHQFAKRQMTWFRRMEKQGMKIHWLDGVKGTDSNLIEVIDVLERKAEEYSH